MIQRGAGGKNNASDVVMMITNSHCATGKKDHAGYVRFEVIKWKCTIPRTSN